MRPRIGITTGRRKGRTMRLANALGVWLAGGRPVTMGPGIRESFDGLDGLIIGGGVDIEARLYGHDISDEWPYDPDRDALEIAALDWADDSGIPVLGICRGMQLLNVHRGGTLHRDVVAAQPDYRNRRSVLPCKTALIEDRSLLSRIAGTDPLRINALHHQAVDRLGHGLVVSARETAWTKRPRGRFASGFSGTPSCCPGTVGTARCSRHWSRRRANATTGSGRCRRRSRRSRAPGPADPTTAAPP